MDRFAELDRRPAPGTVSAPTSPIGCTRSVPTRPTGMIGAPGDHRQMGDPAVATVQQAVARACALRDRCRRACPRASSSAAVVSAAIDAFFTSRLIGTMPNAGKRNLVCRHPCTRPCRGTRPVAAPSPSGAENRRTNDGWRLMIAGPSAGTCSRPRTSARYSSLITGRETNRAGLDSVPTRGSVSVPNARVLTSPSLNRASWLMHAVFHVSTVSRAICPSIRSG